VIDPEGAATLTSINISVQETESPTIDLLFPTAEGSYYSDNLIHFSAIIKDAEDESIDLIYTWESNLDGNLGLVTTPDSDGSISGYTNLTEGQHAISLRVEDTSGKVATEDIAIHVGGANNEPLCSVETPSTGDGYISGQNISFTGTATDTDINNGLLNITWESDLDGVFNSTAPTTDGALAFTYGNLGIGNHAITLKVEDEVGGFCSTAVQIAIGTPPTIVVTTPVDSSVHTISESILFTAVVEDQEDISSDIAVSWVSDIDGEFSTQGSDSTGSIAFGYGLLSGGAHNLTITATDTHGLTTSVVQAIFINTPPPSPTIVLSPNPLMSSDGLNANVTNVADVDGDPISYTYSWYENSILTNITASSVLATELDVGEEWTIRVTPNDGYVDGDYVESSITVSNSAPSLDSVSITPTTAYNDSSLTCAATASDIDQTVTASYEWSIGTNTYAGPTLALSTLSIMPNDTVICTATVVDDDGLSDSSSASLLLENRDPLIDSVTLFPVSPNLDESILCSAVANDEDGEILSVIFSWNNQTSGATYSSSTSNTNSATLELANVAIAVGDVLICSVFVEDAYGGTDSSLLTATIANGMPAFDANASITPSVGVYTGSSLLCTASVSDTEDGVLNPSFSWSVGGLEVATGDNYIVSEVDSDVGDSITCTATATDVDGNQVSSTDVVVVQNTIPIISSASITPVPAYNDSILTCSASVLDPDESLTPTYAWSLGGVSAGIGTTIDLGTMSAAPFDTVVCTVSVSDSLGETDSDFSSLVLENRLPSAPSILISPTAPIEAVDDLLCSIDTFSVDLDGDAIDYYFSWMVNGSPYMGSTNSTVYTDDGIPAAMTIEGEVWTCTVTPNDGAQDGDFNDVDVTIQGEPFLGCSSPVVTDLDGNNYSTVDIGEQCWMASNLNTTQDAQGSSVARWCCDCNQYGGMYSWSAVMNGSTTEGTQGICPDGWHVPSNLDWFELESYLDPSMTNPTYTGWSSTTIADVLYTGGPYGFDWTTGGFSYGGNSCSYNYDRIGYWTSSDYSSSEAISRFFNTGISGINRDPRIKTFGFYVRCVED
jgi:uncharacterized protein (TIGR02145 family)